VTAERNPTLAGATSERDWPGLGWFAAAGSLSAVAGVVLVVLGDRLSFFNDDWYFLLQRPGLESKGGLGSVLAPHNSNLVAVPALIYKALVLCFGLSSQIPFRVVLGAAIAALGMVVFKLVARRAGAALGLAAAVIVLFLGAAWEDLLFFASIDLIGSLIAGGCALLALEADTRRQDVAACVLLVISVGCSNLGVAFLVSAFVFIVFVRRQLPAVWIVLVPAVIFFVWWVTDGTTEPSHYSSGNLTHLPGYVLHSVSSGLTSLIGVNAGTNPTTYHRGEIVLALAAVLLLAWLIRFRRPSLPRLAVPVVGLLSFWVLSGASFYPGREPFASRYQLIDVTFMLLAIAEIAAPVRLPRWAQAGVLLLATVSATLNVTNRLESGYEFLRTQASYVKADLGVLRLTAAHAPAGVQLTDTVAHNPYLSGITIGRYSTETRAHGTPASDSIAAISAASGAVRQSADGVLQATEPLTPTTVGKTNETKCRKVGNQPGDLTETAITPGVTFLRNDGATGLAVAARRFAPYDLPVYIALIAPDTTERLVIPNDPITVPWRLHPRGATSATPITLSVCG
jgi:hypothetical protein